MDEKLENINIRVANDPEFFVFSFMKRDGRKFATIIDQNFFEQIAKKYQHTSASVKLSLFFLHFLQGPKHLTKNLSFNISILSHVHLFPAIVKNYISSTLFNIFEKKAANSHMKNSLYFSNPPLQLNLFSQPVLHLSVAKKSQLTLHKQVKSFLKPGIQNNPLLFHYLKKDSLNLIDYLIKEELKKITKGKTTTSVIKSKNILPFPFAKEELSILHFWQTISSHFEYTDLSKRLWAFIKPDITKVPNADTIRRSRLIQNYDYTKNNQHNIIKEKIAKPISLLPIGKTIQSKSTALQDRNTLKEGYAPMGSSKHFEYTDFHKRLRTFIKPDITKAPNAAAAVGRDRLILNYDYTKNNRHNIMKEEISKPISLLPIRKTIQSRSTALRERNTLKEGHTSMNRSKGEKSLAKESDTTDNNISERFYLNKKFTFNKAHMTFLDHNIIHTKQIHRIRKYNFLKNINEDVLYNDFKKHKKGFFYYRNFEKNINAVRDSDKPILTIENTLSPKELTKSNYRYNLPDMIYFTSKKSQKTSDIVQKSEMSGKTELSQKDFSYKTDSVKPSSIPEFNVHSIADRVYGLIVERVKRERQMRGW